MWLNARRVVSFVFVERNEYFSFTFYTKMSALLLKASPFSPSVLALAKTNTKQSSLRSQRKQSSSDVVVSASAGVGQGTSLPSLPSLARVRLRFLFCYPFAGKSINLSNVIVILMTMISPRLSLFLSVCFHFLSFFYRYYSPSFLPFLLLLH